MGATYKDEENPYHKIKRSVGEAVGQSSVLFKSEDGKRLDGIFDDKQAQVIVEGLLADIDTYAEACVTEYNRVQDEKRASILKQGDWRNSPDAMVWAEKFVELCMEPGVTTDAGLMAAWFARAMAAASYHADNEVARMRDEREQLTETIKHIRERDDKQSEMLKGIQAIVEGEVRFEGMEDMKPQPVMSKMQTTPLAAQAPAPRKTGQGRTLDGRRFVDYEDGSRRWLLTDDPKA